LPPDASELLGLALSMATAVAERHHAGGTGKVQSKSSRTDPVTDVDRDSESIVTAMLAEHRPGDSVLGEEGAATIGTTGVRWVIDPLDGTVNYLYGLPSHAVSIAAEYKGATVVAVVHDTALSTVYSAALGQGATCDGQPIAPNAVSDPSHALVATGFGYEAATRARQAAVLARFLPHVRDIRRAGSAAVDLCWAARGFVDAYYEVGPQLWDVAAGTLIVTEAGGRVSYDPSTKRTLAAGPDLFGPLDALISRAEAVNVAPDSAAPA